MAETGFSTFNTTVDRTNAILHEIETANGWPKQRRAQSYTALRAVLHALRDRLAVADAVQLGAQLPLLVRGVYYDGWAPKRVPMKMSSDQFTDRVRHEFTYAVPGGVEPVISSVLQALRRHISDGEWQDMLAVMPTELRSRLADWSKSPA
jgi:uncharacterized protein (DUF2267 family)